MSTKQVASAFVVEHYCDMCGKMISDGKGDGMGGSNFWGQYIQMLKHGEPEITLKATDLTYDESLVIKIGFPFGKDSFWEVCSPCASDVKAFIDGRRVNVKE